MPSTESDRVLAEKIALSVAEQGGRVYYVGGCVRDQLMGRPCKDIDIEVHGLRPDQLEEILDCFGERLEYGKSFGIYGIRHAGLDIALPRTERPVGSGHRDFEVKPDPYIGTYGAALRRDFTVNAMMRDVLTGEIVDHFRGQDDLRQHLLRYVNDESFAEDPLRVLRCAQFSARFDFSVAEDTDRLCSRMSLKDLSRERVYSELEKALKTAAKPSVFFETLRRQHQLSVWFPEIESLCDVPQDPSMHAEGDVWAHTMMVLDAAASLRDRASDVTGFMLAALLHDVGKPLCTAASGGKIHAYDHEILGLVPAEKFLDRLTGSTSVKKYVLNLVRLHMRPNIMSMAGSSVKKTNHLFDEALDPDALIALARADMMGQLPCQNYELTDAFLCERLKVYREIMSRPYVQGRDLVAAGITPGPELSEILAYAHKLRLAGIEKNDALKQTLAYARKKLKLSAGKG